MLRTARTLASSSVRRRGLVVASLTLVERLLAPGLFLTYFKASGLVTIVVAGSLAAIVAARGVFQRAAAARAEAELYRRFVGSLVGGDVLASTPDEDARTALFEGFHRVGTLLAEGLPNLAANAVAAAALAIAFAASASSRLTLVVVAAVGVAAVVLYASRGWVDRAQAEVWRAWGSMVEAVADACDGRLDIVASGKRDAFVKGFITSSRAWEAHALRAARVAGLSGRVPLAGVAILIAAAVVLEARASGASWDEAILRAGLLASSAPALIGVGAGIQSLVSNKRRVELIARVCAVAERPVVSATLPDVIDHVEWRDVAFSYPSSDATLRDVTFSWKRGELLALAGANGSGKSTCLRLVLGIGKPTSGKILVNDISLESCDVDAWRQRIGFLSQRPFLPARATVAECLCAFDSGTDRKVLEAAIERVGLLATLRRLANDPLSVRVGSLSAGEKQRVALARVLCRDAALVILDEPDADLDRDGVRIVREIIAELARSRMVLVVAHDPEILAAADRVITLAGGGIVLS